MSNSVELPLFHCRADVRGDSELTPNEHIGWPTIRSGKAKTCKVTICHFTENAAIERLIRSDLHARYDITTMFIDAHVVYIEMGADSKPFSPIVLRRWKCELYIIPIYKPRLMTDVWIDGLAPYSNGVAINRLVDFTVRRTMLLSTIWRGRTIVVTQPCGKTSLWQYDHTGEPRLIHRSNKKTDTHY